MHAWGLLTGLRVQPYGLSVITAMLLAFGLVPLAARRAGAPLAPVLLGGAAGFAGLFGGAKLGYVLLHHDASLGALLGGGLWLPSGAFAGALLAAALVRATGLPSARALDAVAIAAPRPA